MVKRILLWLLFLVLLSALIIYLDSITVVDYNLLQPLPGNR